MPVQVPQFNTLNLPATIGAAEEIKGQKHRNALLGYAVDEEKRAARMRAEIEARRRMSDNAGQAIQQLIDDGELEAAEQLRATMRQQYSATLQVLESAKGWVTEDNYKQVRAHLLQNGVILPDDMPTEYDGSFFDRKIKDTNNKLDKLTVTTGTEDGRAMSTDILQNQYGEVIERGDPYEDPASRKARNGGDGKPWEMDASDSNTIGRSVGEFLGATFSPITNTFSGLNKEQATQAMTIKEEAARIYREHQGKLSHAEAVSQAIRQFGVDIRKLQDERASDPLGIRNHLAPES